MVNIQWKASKQFSGRGDSDICSSISYETMRLYRTWSAKSHKDTFGRKVYSTGVTLFSPVLFKRTLPIPRQDNQGNADMTY